MTREQTAILALMREYPKRGWTGAWIRDTIECRDGWMIDYRRASAAMRGLMQRGLIRAEYPNGYGGERPAATWFLIEEK
jgi:hypothetical protein